MELTKDSKKILFTLFKEFRTRRNSGISRRDAANFRSASFIHSNYFSDWLLVDVEDCLRELGRAGFLDNGYADNTVYFCHLSDAGIAYLELLPAETLTNIIDFIAKFIPLIPLG